MSYLLANLTLLGNHNWLMLQQNDWLKRLKGILMGRRDRVLLQVHAIALLFLRVEALYGIPDSGVRFPPFTYTPLTLGEKNLSLGQRSVSQLHWRSAGCFNAWRPLGVVGLSLAPGCVIQGVCELAFLCLFPPLQMVSAPPGAVVRIHRAQTNV